MPHAADDRSQLVRRLLQLALEQVHSQALILLDANGVIVDWPAGGERLFGYTADEILGRNASVLFTPEDLKQDLSAWELQTAARSGESEDDRWQLRKDGVRVWVSGTLTALRDQSEQAGTHDKQDKPDKPDEHPGHAHGKLVGFAKLMRNRTDQKTQVETLESRVLALRRAEQRKDTFIATLAHELRNPLGAISSAMALLEQCHPAAPQDAPDAVFALGTIRRQIEFIARMIQDLLDVARTATGKIQLRKEGVNLQQIIADAIEATKARLDQRTQQLRQLLPDVPIALDGDSVRLRQVFVNLIENAIKYTRQGGTIWIKGTTEGEDAVVRVQDTGVGIAPDVMPHIFDLFTQAEAGPPKDFTPGGPVTPGGLGIGLSVVRDIVALHGGSVQATSDGLGKGSEFTVRLPLPHPTQSP